MMVYIYILLLQSSKYYIGKTTNPEFRLKDHFTSNGSEWTKMYKPIRIEEIIPNCDPYDEDKYTLKYMETNGIDNVRGGSFSQIELADDKITLIEDMIKGATDKCYICGISGHFADDCIELTLHEYLNSVTTDNIEQKTNEIRSIYDEIIQINQTIQTLDFISINDIPEIKIQSNKMNEVKQLQDESNKLQTQNSRLNENNRIITNEETRRNSIKMVENREKISKIMISRGQRWKATIEQHYRTYFTSGSVQTSPKQDMVILALEIIKYNIQMKQKLRKIYDKYHSEENVKELLIRIYEKGIRLLEYEFDDTL